MALSSEEAKIREELEVEIENDLEQEIKDGIYKLALRLHSLYQHQNQRIKGSYYKKKMVSEVNIIIRLEGGTKVEIKHSKKRGPNPKIKRPITAMSEPGFKCKSFKFDWANSLRSGA